MTRRILPTVLVAVQLCCFGYLALTGPLVARSPLALAVEVVGVLLGAWAMLTMRLRQVRIGPNPAAQAHLVTRGPYRLIRHPMYTGVLLVALALVWDRFSVDRLFIFAALALDLSAKMRYEEGLLASRFPEYAEYRRRAKRLIPWVY